MGVAVEVFHTAEVFQREGQIIYFWQMRDSTHYWGYNVFPSPFDHPFQQVSVDRTTYSRESDGREMTNLWVTCDRGGLIFFIAMRAPL